MKHSMNLEKEGEQQMHYLLIMKQLIEKTMEINESICLIDISKDFDSAVRNDM